MRWVDSNGDPLYTAEELAPTNLIYDDNGKAVELEPDTEDEYEFKQ